MKETQASNPYPTTIEKKENGWLYRFQKCDQSESDKAILEILPGFLVDEFESSQGHFARSSDGIVELYHLEGYADNIYELRRLVRTSSEIEFYATYFRESETLRSWIPDRLGIRSPGAIFYETLESVSDFYLIGAYENFSDGLSTQFNVLIRPTAESEIEVCIVQNPQIELQLDQFLCESAIDWHNLHLNYGEYTNWGTFFDSLLSMNNVIGPGTATQSATEFLHDYASMAKSEDFVLNAPLLERNDLPVLINEIVRSLLEAQSD